MPGVVTRAWKHREPVQVEGIPAVLVPDADGRVVKRNDGFLPKAGMVKFLAID
jgi:hypothetical protein